MTYALQQEINVLQILPKKYQMTKLTSLPKNFKIPWIYKMIFRYFVLLLKEIEMLHSRYNPMDNPRVKMFPLNEKMCNVTSSEVFSNQNNTIFTISIIFGSKYKKDIIRSNFVLSIKYFLFLLKSDIWEHENTSYNNDRVIN